MARTIEFASAMFLRGRGAGTWRATPRPRRPDAVDLPSRYRCAGRSQPMSADCLFCKIAAKQITSRMVYEDDDVFAFEDIGPQAPTHILICPRKHIASLNEAAPEDQAILGKVQLVAAELARKFNLLSGYRTVLNTGPGAGQSVFHLHLHLLGVRSLHWPPG